MPFLGDVMGGSGLGGVQTFSQQTNQTQNVADATRNVFSDPQKALQGQSLGFISNLLGGSSVPQNFGLPQVVYDAAMANFNKYHAPQLAAIHGSGSPTINSAMQELQLQLAAQGAKVAVGNAIDAFQAAAQWAFTPIGTDKTTTSTLNEDVSGRQTGVDIGGILQGVVNLFPGGGFPTPTPNIFV